MISTKAKEVVDKVEQMFQQYIKMEHPDRDAFMNKVSRWLIDRIENDNKQRLEESNK